MFEIVYQQIKDLTQEISEQEELWQVELLESQVLSLLTQYALLKNYHLDPQFAFLNLTQLLEDEDYQEELEHPFHDYLHYWFTRMASQDTYSDITQLMDLWQSAYEDLSVSHKDALTLFFNHIHHES